jgi:hypothetical protein
VSHGGSGISASASQRPHKCNQLVYRMIDDDLDEDFPLGDGTADTSTEVMCPYCGETTSISVDPGGGSFQQYVEDCEVCCNPWQVSVQFNDGLASVDLLPLDR